MKKTLKSVRKKPKKQKYRQKLVIWGIFLLAGLMMFLVFKSQKDPNITWYTSDNSTSFQQKYRSQGREIPLCEKMTIESWYSYHSCYVVNCTVFAKAAISKQEELSELIKRHDDLIKDNLRSVIASVGPEHIRDPHLQVVKRKLKHNLDQIVGKGMTDEILIPEWQSFRAY